MRVGSFTAMRMSFRDAIMASPSAPTGARYCPGMGVIATDNPQQR
jgi:hypothetical protein